MQTKFFTNDDGNSLLAKIEGIFTHRNIYFFDALVGYFYASGYFRIRPYIKRAGEVRVLVGINVDKMVYEASRQGVLFSADAYKSQEDFFESIKKNIQQAKYSKAVEEGMLGMIDDIVSGKLQIRVHPKQNIHAKVYVFREEVRHDHGYGSVITGSSNLTEPGLERNFEFNVELRENGDIDFATETFNRLWDESVPVSEEFIARLKTETFLNDQFTAYEVYLKFLIEYFGKSIDYDPNSETDLPKGFMPLAYQADAVNDGYNKMAKHGGFFLSDVVGLGKTIIATRIAKKFYFKNGFPEYRSRTLIVVPPALKQNWDETIEKFSLDGVHIVTNGSLHKVRNPSQYDMVIVDEAHKFRSDTAEAYNDLQKICKTPTRRRKNDGSRYPKRVMLVSATPLNNYPQDIANLVYLFQDSKDSTLEIGNLQHFFRQHIDAYRRLKQEPDMQKVKEGVRQIYEQIRVKVIEPLTVRRTRTDLKIHSQYKDDLAAQKIEFPDVRKPEKILYQLAPHLEMLYDQTIRQLTHPTEGLTYNRYRAIGALKPHKKQKYKKADMISTQLAKIMKTMLVKRIDSSFYAFRQSIRRFCDANDAMLKMFDTGRVFIAPNLPVSDMINDGREDELFDLVTTLMDLDPTVDICVPDDFEPGFYQGLKRDQAILNDLSKAWDDLGDEDPKLNTFVEYLHRQLFDDTNREKKLVVFSESKETTEYVARRLKSLVPHRILTVDSHTRKDRMPTIRANFDANLPTDLQQNEYDIIISTEVLAEGVNLHRANVIVNYDTPWNATRLMQRIGRVNRIGTKAKAIYIYNFFPTAQVDNDIDLQKKAMMKLQAFHAALGEDSQIYSPDEEIESFGLFDKEVDEERDEKLDYLMEIRNLKEKDPDLFKRIKTMPLRARVGRKDRMQHQATIAFIRDQKRDAFLYVHANKTAENYKVEELTFLETAKRFQCMVHERATKLHDLHHEQVQLAVDRFQAQVEAEKAQDKKVDVSQGPNEKKALMFLDAFLSLPFISEDEKALVGLAKDAIRRGRFQNLQRDINKLQKTQSKVKVQAAILLEHLMKILNSYPLSEPDEDVSVTPVLPVVVAPTEPAIIISESFSM
ncbi:helicase-related protein [Spirosoma radiotolerans]|uniref:Helicase n=1 Tax=Spirosoma radiotolerans TaxID=1379870 RepID=A0A0E3ZX16_9BACT|nr:helicase-related protein [Spirosoma radiotolerans]AKD56694.1 helicase [Spirosoma radiotolerans]